MHDSIRVQSIVRKTENDVDKKLQNKNPLNLPLQRFRWKETEKSNMNNMCSSVQAAEEKKTNDYDITYKMCFVRLSACCRLRAPSMAKVSKSSILSFLHWAEFFADLRFTFLSLDSILLISDVFIVYCTVGWRFSCASFGSFGKYVVYKIKVSRMHIIYWMQKLNDEILLFLLTF